MHQMNCSCGRCAYPIAEAEEEALALELLTVSSEEELKSIPREARERSVERDQEGWLRGPARSLARWEVSSRPWPRKRCPSSAEPWAPSSRSRASAHRCRSGAGRRGGQSPRARDERHGCRKTASSRWPGASSGSPRRRRDSSPRHRRTWTPRPPSTRRSSPQRADICRNCSSEASAAALHPHPSKPVDRSGQGRHILVLGA